VVSVANHGYWNLAGGASIADHELCVPAEQRLICDPSQIPIGVAEVAGTAHDLREMTSLGPVLQATDGLDDCYLLGPEGGPVDFAAELRHPGSGRTLTVSTDAPGLQVYTGNNLHAPFARHQSVSLEAQRLPDAPNQPALGPCILRPGERYAATTLLEFSASPH